MQRQWCRGIVSMRRRLAAALWVAGAAALAPGVARAQLEVDYSISVLNDTRFDVGRLWEVSPDTSDDVGSRVDRTGDPEFSRNETSVQLKVSAAPVERVRFVADLELIWRNMSDRQLGLAELTDRAAMDPWRLECDAAYVDLLDIAPGLDIRIGRQIVHWGSADMFNPTDNINPDDLEDPVMFGENIANEMLRIDYTYMPDREGWLGDVTFSLIWVPIFRPSQLPRSATLPLADSSEEIPVLEPDVREQINSMRSTFSYLIDDPEVFAETPRFSLENSQLGLRVQARMGETDFALSYYRGFDDIPVMTRTDANFNDAGLIESTSTLVYPRMQVFGFDINGQIPFLDDLGFWVEGAVIFPDRVPLVFAFGESLLLPQGLTFEGTAVDDRPFLKLTVGIDYSFNQYVFMNVQYVRGFMNDFGATNLNNFIVAGVDIKLWNDRILFRLFGLLQLDWLDEDLDRPFREWSDQISANLFPMFRINPWGSTELDLGAVIPIGSRDSYFGQPATGPVTMFLRARAAF